MCQITHYNPPIKSDYDNVQDGRHYSNENCLFSRRFISHAAFFVNADHFTCLKHTKYLMTLVKALKMFIKMAKIARSGKNKFEIRGSCKVSNHDNVLSTGLPAGTIRGFTTLHNTTNQNDLEALDLFVCFIFGTNLCESKTGERDPVCDKTGEIHRNTFVNVHMGMCV